MFHRQSRLCDLFVLNRIKKVRFSTKSLHISAFLPKFTQNLRMSDYGNKQEATKDYRPRNGNVNTEESISCIPLSYMYAPSFPCHN